MKIASAAFALLLLMGTPVNSAEVLSGPIKALVISVYDGDTFTVRVFAWPDLTIRVSVRVAGIDTPEIRGKCHEEKVKALAAKAYTMGAVGQYVSLYDIRKGKYAGRVIARVETQDGHDLGALLIVEGLARFYKGGTRKGWCSGDP